MTVGTRVIHKQSGAHGVILKLCKNPDFAKIVFDSGVKITERVQFLTKEQGQ